MAENVGKGPYLEQVKGDTWRICTAFSSIPMFRLDKKYAILIDSGLPDEGAGGLFSLLEREGIQVRAILTSHYHLDHSGNHKAFQQKGAAIYMSLFDAGISNNYMGIKLFNGGDSYKATRYYSRHQFCDADEIIFPRQESVTVEGAEFPIVRLPGHTPEHMGFITPDNVAYLADVIMEDELLESIRIPYVGCCAEDLKSKTKAGGLLCERYILAHNGVCDEVAGLAARNIAKLEEKIRIVESQANRWMTMEKLAYYGAMALGTSGETLGKIFTAERNTFSMIEYLLDERRLVNRVHEGAVEYIRTELSDNTHINRHEKNKKQEAIYG